MREPEPPPSAPRTPLGVGCAVRHAEREGGAALLHHCVCGRCKVVELRAVGFTAAQLEDAGFSAGALRGGKFAVGDLKGILGV